jgi:hypothetical protein
MYATKAPPSKLTPVASAATLIRRMNALKAQRQPHEYVWRDCFDHCFPLRGSGLQQNTLTAQSGIDRAARLVDSTATDGGRILAASLQGGMTPANARWFGLDVHNAQDAWKTWLDAAADQLHVEIHNANFDSESLDCMLDMVAAGWFVMFVDVDREQGGLVFESWPIAQCYIASSRADGRVDTLYRSYTMTAEQCVSEFGADKVSSAVAKKAVDSPDHMVNLCHAIYPRVGSNGQMAKNMPFASCKVEVDSQILLVESGFHEFPCVVPRMNKIPDTAYAVGPMFDALPDARMLNQMKRMDLANADLAIAGMWIAKDDGVLNPRTVKVGARKIIVANDVDSMKPLVSGGNWQLADERIAQLQMAIRKLLMADQLQPQDGPAMTATEIHARVALIRQQLGPTFGRMQAEYLRSLIERCFALAFRAGIFPPPPDALAGQGFSVKYISPLARAQNLEDVTAIQNAVAFLIQVAPFAPTVLDNYDLDEMSRTLSEAQGVPQKCIRDMKAVLALRDARGQQQQAAQQQQQAQGIQSMAADAAFKGAQARATKNA